MTESFAVVVVTILVLLGIIGAAVAWWINRPRHGEHAYPDESLALFGGESAIAHRDPATGEYASPSQEFEDAEGFGGPPASGQTNSVSNYGKPGAFPEHHQADKEMVERRAPERRLKVAESADDAAFEWSDGVLGGPAKRDVPPDRRGRGTLPSRRPSLTVDQPAEPPSAVAALGEPALGKRPSDKPPTDKAATGPVPSFQADPSIAHGRSVRFDIPADGTLQFLPGRLEIVSGHDSGREIRFVRLPGVAVPEITFGRVEGARYRHVQLMEGTVSRLHARIRLGESGGNWVLMNLSTTNPVAYNSRILGENEEQALKDEDRIEMGEVVFRFRER